MKYQPPPLETQITIAKTLAMVIFLVYFIHAPVEFFHHLLEIIHILYESIAYVLEEILHHTLHLNKFESQLIVFYLTWCVVFAALYRVWLHMPVITERVKMFFYAHYFRLRILLFKTWPLSGLGQKIKLLFIPLVFIVSMFVFVLT